MDTTGTDDDPALDLAICTRCGADITEEASAYGLPNGEWLCLDCAVARGGRFDAADERWLAAPDLEGLALRAD